jgi:diguanylate cyclase (GGDEF)-like protein
VDAFAAIIDNVVAKMAFNGEGPLAPEKTTELSDKAGLAAREISRASSELWALYEVAQSLSTSLGVQETVNILAHKLEAIFPDASTSFLLKEADGTLKVIAAAGLNRDYMLGAYTFKPGTASVNVVEGKTSYVGEFDAEDLMLMTSEYEPWHPVQTSLIVPIVYQGEALGTINLYHQQEDAFSEHDKDLLEMIAERSALALYNGMLYERTKSHAIKDPLTGLFNIRHLTEEVDTRCQAHTLEGNPPARFALLCLDIDSFKPINDNFGHQKGDEVLREVARIITEAVPEQSVVCRYGGDEFLILLDGAERDQAVEVASQIERGVQAYDPNLVHYKLGSLRIDVSIGLACFPEDGKDCTSLISFADTNMYQEKTEHKLGVLAAKNERKSAAA